MRYTFAPFVTRPFNRQHSTIKADRYLEFAFCPTGRARKNLDTHTLQIM